MRIVLVAAVALVLPACSGVVLGNLGVLAVTLAIFVGTLSLGRPAAQSAAQSPDGAAARSADGADPRSDLTNR